MLVARCALGLGLLVVLCVGCGQTKGGSVFPSDGGIDAKRPGDDDGSDCPLLCSENTRAVLDLSGGTADLVSVMLTGACATSDADPSNYTNGSVANVYISSPNAGVCHIELVFATGCTYAASVTFTSQTDDPACCPSYLVPMPPTFMVNNPGATCVDAGFDAGG
jgi:hypothetical protein